MCNGHGKCSETGCLYVIYFFLRFFFSIKMLIHVYTAYAHALLNIVAVTETRLDQTKCLD